MKDKTVAVAFCINVLDHCKDPAKVLSEIKRVVREGGFLILDVETWFGRAPWVVDIHLSRLDIGNLKELILQSGFEIQSEKHLVWKFGIGPSLINRLLLAVQRAKFGEAFFILKGRGGSKRNKSSIPQKDG